MCNEKTPVFLLLIIATVAICSCVADADEGDESSRKLPAAATKQIDFVSQVQPILKHACIGCHGPEKQKGEYRLDVREIALTGGESSAPNIVSGKSAESPLIRFVTGAGDVVMPPEGQRLTSGEIGLLRAWIDQGARWPDEVAGKVRDKRDLWSLKPLIRPAVPRIETAGNQPAPIDAFIRAKLDEHAFRHAPEADRRTLIRRVFFDLIGLPPTPDEVDSFVSDPDQNAYEKLVEQLLASSRYGERWARHWLDAAHFAETHGNDQDRIRENAWPYRDYLITALNNDTRYDRFVKEQIAGDVLFPETPSAIAALGFLAAGPWDESSLRDIREDTLDRQIARYLDRDDMLATVMNNLNSMTVQCARCHDHKFDPISQRDYYSLQAVFSGVERANRRYDADPQIHRQRSILLERKKSLEQRSPEVMASLLTDEISARVAAWEQRRGNSGLQWRIIDAESVTSSDGATLTKQPDGSILSGGLRPDKDTVTIVSGPLSTSTFTASETSKNENDRSSVTGADKTPSTISRITAVRLEVLTDESLPRRGPGRQDNGNFHLSEFEVYADDRQEPETLINPSADFNQQDWGIAKAIDRNEPTAWGIDPKEGMSHQAVFELKEPLRLAGVPVNATIPSTNESQPRTATRLRIVLKQLHGRAHLIGRTRLSVIDAPSPVRADDLPETLAAILAIPASQRSDIQRQELALFQQLDEINVELSSLPKQSLVYAAAADFEPDGSMRPPTGPRPIHVLHRGDIRNPREETGPGTLACISTLSSRFEIPANAPESARRAALAGWLTHQDNPLTWRSIVNRIWHHHFGRGIVGTLNDFGQMGETPSHPELLDWLAVEFRDSGQSLKSLHRLIVTSQTYRQTVESPARAFDKTKDRQPQVDPRVAQDADNRLLWRMNRIRLDAESVRDAVLAISGRLDLRMGGPSDRQFDLQPGIHVTPRVDYAKFDLNSDLGRRRSIYRFLFRTLPDPFMETLDCPSGDQITPARGNSVTVQQALALWNDAFIANHCEQIAARIKRDLAGQLPEASVEEVSLLKEIELAVRLILGRKPNTNERPDFMEYTRKHGLANLCRLLLNSNEFLFVN